MNRTRQILTISRHMHYFYNDQYILGVCLAAAENDKIFELIKLWNDQDDIDECEYIRKNIDLIIEEQFGDLNNDN